MIPVWHLKLAHGAGWFAIQKHRIVFQKIALTVFVQVARPFLERRYFVDIFDVLQQGVAVRRDDGSFAATHPELINEANENYFGLDPAHEVDARDDIVVPSLVIPVNRPILLRMHAKDVNHSFYVPELRIQQDFVPGLVIPLHFTATQTGKYEIVCTQLCGLGHYNMRAYVEVMSPGEFDQWLKEKAAQQ